MSDTTALCVVLPFNKVNDLLFQSIDSVLNSTWEDFELLAIADNVGDLDLAVLLNRYSGKKVKIIKSSGTGIVAALNFGIHLSKSTFIARLDGDDICVPTRFEIQINEMMNNPGLAVLGTQVEYICIHGRTRGYSNYRKFPNSNGVFKFTDSPVAHPSVMFRRQVFLAAGQYREGFMHAEDLDLWFRMATHGKIQILDEKLLKYRQHQGQISNTFGKLQKIGALKAFLSDLQDNYKGNRNVAKKLEEASKTDELVAAALSMNDLMNLNLRGDIRLSLKLAELRFGTYRARNSNSIDVRLDQQNSWNFSIYKQGTRILAFGLRYLKILGQTSRRSKYAFSCQLCDQLGRV